VLGGVVLATGKRDWARIASSWAQEVVVDSALIVSFMKVLEFPILSMKVKDTQEELEGVQLKYIPEYSKIMDSSLLAVPLDG